MNPLRRFATVAVVALMLASLALPNARAVTIDWVTVGDAGNAPDTTGYGAVNYEYRIMTFEFTNSQYAAFLNAIDPDGTNANAVYNSSMGSDIRGGITNTGTINGSRYAVKSNMDDKPVNLVSWWDAARVSNWLHNGGQTYGSTDSSASAPQNTGAYSVGTATSGDAVAVNSGALFYVPTENEWYKAAYYNPSLNSGSGGYRVYGNGFDTTPGIVSANEFGVGSAGDTGSFANYEFGADWNDRDGNVTTVGTNGGASYYEAFDMSGNVWELNDLTGAAGSSRAARGGSWSYSAVYLSSSFRTTAAPLGEDIDYGFRLASPANAVSDLILNVLSGQQTQAQLGYAILSGTATATKTGLGALVLDAANTLSSSLSVNEGTVLAANPQAIGTAALNVASGAAFAIDPRMGSMDAVRIKKLGTIAGTFDVGAGRFTLDSSAGVTEMTESLLVSGRNSGDWNGTPGITSTAAAADLQNGIVRSVGWKANPDGSVTVAYAAPGDTNLDGEVNVFDLVNVNGSGTYGRGTPSNWSQGDFDYNGVTNIFDMVQTNGAGVYGRGNYLPVTPPSVNAVPEPATCVMALACLACGGYTMVRRRERA